MCASCGQAKEWLTAVNQGKYDAYVALIISHLEEALQPQPATTSSSSSSSNGNKQTLAVGAAAAAASKRKYDISSSFLGTTTIAGRSKRNGVVNASTSSSSSSGAVGPTAASVTAGRILATLKLPTLKPPTSTSTFPIITDEERAAAEEYFASVISQRSQFEIRRREALEVRRKEMQRLAHETASLHRTLGGNNTSSSSANGVNGAVDKQGKDVSAVELKGKVVCYMLTRYVTSIGTVQYLYKCLNLSALAIINHALTIGDEADVTAASSEPDLDALFGGHVTVIKATSIPTPTPIKAQSEKGRLSPPVDSTASTTAATTSTTSLTGKRKLIDTNTTPPAVVLNQNKVVKTSYPTSTTATPTTDIPSTIQSSIKVEPVAPTTTATVSMVETLKPGLSPTLPVAKKAKRKFVIG